MATVRPSACSRCDRRVLVARQDLREDAVRGDADRAGHRLGGRARVAGQQPDLEAGARAAPATASADAGSDRVGDRDQAGGRAVDGHEHRGPAVRRGGPRRVDERREVDARARPSAAGCRPTTVAARRPSRGRRVRRSPRTRRPAWKPSSSSRARRDDRLAERDAREPRLERGREVQQLRRRRRPDAGTTAATSGRPRVRVPVLSKTTVSTRPAVSSASPPRMRMPASAALARPDHDRGRRGEAHGARAGDDQDPDEGREGEREARLRADQHTRRRTSATRARGPAGTNTSLTRSASRWIGALEPWARSTSSTICASAVSRPTRVARITNEPVVLRVAADDLVAGRLRDRASARR